MERMFPGNSVAVVLEMKSTSLELQHSGSESLQECFASQPHRTDTGRWDTEDQREVDRAGH